MDKAWTKIVANFIINVVLSKWKDQTKPPPLPSAYVRYLCGKIYHKEMSFGEAKKTYFKTLQNIDEIKAHYAGSGKIVEFECKLIEEEIP